MVEHIQRPIVFVEDEFDVVVVCNVVDSDGHQIRRSTPEQSHRDAVRLSRRQFRPRNVAYGFEHREIPSQLWEALLSPEIASKALAPTADQCASLHPEGGDLSVPATGQRRKVEHSTEGLEAAHTIREEFPEIGILALSGHVEIEHAAELLATGDRINIRAAQARLMPRGLFCLRVNAVGTDLAYAHDVVERDDSGGFTVRYQAGPKSRLNIHFFAELELSSLFADYAPVLAPRVARTWRRPPERGPVVAMGGDLAPAGVGVGHDLGDRLRDDRALGVRRSGNKKGHLLAF
jgi:hypothetical protein